MALELTVAELRASGERSLGASDWHAITQDQVDGFADLTGDHQWIHVDPERARTGPFGTTVAHGYLTLSLLPRMLGEILIVTDMTSRVNYGTDRVRFTSPVAVGSRVRTHARLISCAERGAGTLYKLGVELEVEGQAKRAMIGETLFLVFS